jgi:predicted Zn-dependent protease
MLERKGSLDEAIRHYRAAIENKPDFRQAHFQLGHLLLMQKKPGEAIAELSQTLKPEDGDTPRFMYALGVAYAEVKDYAGAERNLRQAADMAAASGQEPLAEKIRGVLASVQRVQVEQARK